MRRQHAVVFSLAVAFLPGCGSSGKSHQVARLPVVQVAASPATALHVSSPRGSAGATSCQDVWARELSRVATRIYDQAAGGRNVKSSVRRVRKSRALSRAVQRGDARAARRALVHLARKLIVRIEVWRGRRLLAHVGSSPAPAPVAGPVMGTNGRPVGRFVLTVTNDRQYAGITSRLTGAAVEVRAGRRRVVSGTVSRASGARRSYFSGQAFPSGRLRVTLVIPRAPASLCASRLGQARLNTAGYVARRLLKAENHSRAVTQTLNYATRNAAFRRAVASADPAAIRNVVSNVFFREHRFHIVRVRVTRRPHLVADIGGPFVLAPASRTMRSPSGRALGRVTLAVQDDTGYIKLVHRFTGADVILRGDAGQVPGSSLSPGPPSIPKHGLVSYAGRRYRALSFDGRAFPSGRLRISILVPVAAKH